MNDVGEPQRGGRDDAPAGPVDESLAALDPVEIDVEAIRREEHAASLKIAGIEAGRRKAGVVGAVVAGTMLTLHEIYEGPPRDVDIVVESETSGKVGDIDADGIEVTVGDVDVWAPPPPPPDRAP